jgi:hypothetical protein
MTTDKIDVAALRRLLDRADDANLADYEPAKNGLDALLLAVEERDALVARIKEGHNGYGETGISLGMPEPATPLQALDEVLRETVEVGNAELIAQRDALSRLSTEMWDRASEWSGPEASSHYRSDIRERITKLTQP